MIKKDDIEYTAELSRIGLEEEEKKSLQKDLSEILSYIEKLKELDVSKTDPAIHPADTSNITRVDIPEHCLFKEEIIKLFPEKKGRFLKVPPIKDSFK